jgi:trans-aconitate methyltransferase
MPARARRVWRGDSGNLDGMSERGEPWERTYATRSDTELSWYEREPATSLRLIESVASGSLAAVVDIGGGTSTLVDRLLDLGFEDLTVLDISANALEQVRTRLGDRAGRVQFVHHDVLTWEPDRHYDVLHDRAVFHFVTLADERAQYVEVVGRALRSGGAMVIATFASDGPTHCSGLPVTRYSPNDLAQTFSERFSLVAHELEDHITPTGVVQPFTWAVLRRS